MSVCPQRRGRCDHCELVQTRSLGTLPPTQSALPPSPALQHVALAPGHVQTCSLEIYLHSSGERSLVIEIAEKEILALAGMLELFNNKLFH